MRNSLVAPLKQTKPKIHFKMPSLSFHMPGSGQSTWTSWTT